MGDRCSPSTCQEVALEHKGCAALQNRKLNASRSLINCFIPNFFAA